jgi:tetratricopeptide (TPR) repeat protein
VRALAIHERQLGANHPETAASLNNLALLYLTQERYAEAEPLYRRALAIYKQQMGPEYPNTRTIRKNYVSLLRTMGHNEEVRKLEEGS